MAVHPPPSMAMIMILLSIGTTYSFTQHAQFARQIIIPSLHRSNVAVHIPPITTFLAATSKGGGVGGGKKKRRRRKTSTVKEKIPSETKTVDLKTVDDVSATAPAPSFDTSPIEPVRKEDSGDEATETDEASSSGFSFNRNEAIALGISDAEDEDDIPPAFAPSDAKSGEGLKVLPELGKGAMVLPDIKDTLKKKKKKDKDVQTEEEDKEDDRERIQRGDTAGLKKLLEVDPNADTDFSYFVEEGYGTVSVLLGEGAKTFLGIPSGVLQVGHTIGALVIVLMAFVQYPGFPLTNLPSPLRGALQGGLGAVYAINAVLAIFAIFKAGERGQPSALWAVKTFTTGGLAFDQLTQIPTTEQLEAMKAKKGKRALKKNKR